MHTRICKYSSFARDQLLGKSPFLTLYIVNYISSLLIFSCGTPSSYEICKQQTTEFIPYEEILKAQNSTSPLWLNTLILMMFFLVFRGLGYAVLRYLRCPKKT